jgi:hypothetical protein
MKRIKLLSDKKNNKRKQQQQQNTSVFINFFSRLGVDPVKKKVDMTGLFY